MLLLRNNFPRVTGISHAATEPTDCLVCMPNSIDVCVARWMIAGRAKGIRNRKGVGWLVE